MTASTNSGPQAALAAHDQAPQSAISHETLTAIIGVLVLMMTLAAKGWLIFRQNINWDEFHYLSQVHEHARGELQGQLQTLHVWLFAWLPSLGGDEIDQIIAARCAMLGLLAASCALIWQLAGRWLPPAMAMVAPAAWILTMPVIRHGASFRSDGLLVPLSLACTCVLTGPRLRTTHLTCAGLLLGLAGAINIKAVFLAPVLVGMLLSRSQQGIPPASLTSRCWLRLRSVALLAAVAAVVFAALHLAHGAALAGPPPESSEQLAHGAWRKTIAETDLFPRIDYLVPLSQTDSVFWACLLIGGAIALARRKMVAVCCSLSLLPLAFYRNAFPYYYPVMLATASIFVAFVCDAAYRQLAKWRAQSAWLAPVLLVGLLAWQGFPHLASECRDTMAQQRAVVAAVHQIFPKPVPYLDHSGMISSFPKANFFMTTWRMEDYRATGIAFMPGILAGKRPPLLVANRRPLDPRLFTIDQLMPEDSALIRASYIRYWGPVFVAGTELHGPGRVFLPFPGEYRLEAAHALLLDDAFVAPGETITVTDAGRGVTFAPTNADTVAHARLVWAAAHPAPDVPPPIAPIYLPLLRSTYKSPHGNAQAAGQAAAFPSD